MANRNDGGFAFPMTSYEGPKHPNWVYNEGMTLRDWFAGKVPPQVFHEIESLSAEFAAKELGISIEEYAKDPWGNFLKLNARIAYEWADAMLKARDEGREEAGK